jgi:hypothetical protein
MPDEPDAPFRLDDEQRARVTDCLGKEALSVPSDRLEQFAGDIEASIAQFHATPSETTFRDARDAVRTLWMLAHEDDPPIGQLRVRLARLPHTARERMGRRASMVMRRLGFDLGGPANELPERAFDRFLEWTKTPEAMRLPRPSPRLQEELPEKLAIFAGPRPVSLAPLVIALRALTSQGSRPVEGRSRGGGKRSASRMEPRIMGEMRHRGGRPANECHQSLVMHLATDWLTATCAPPKPGRSDNSGFGDLVHSVFQWLGLPDDSATYALRQFWDAVRQGRAQGRRTSLKPTEPDLI